MHIFQKTFCLFVLFGSLSVVGQSGTICPLPISAHVTTESPDGKGWLQSGCMPVTLASARQQFASCLTAAGWHFVHSIPIEPQNNRILFLWRREGKDLTMMLWRIDVGTTGFSWGVGARGQQTTPRQAGRKEK